MSRPRTLTALAVALLGAVALSPIASAADIAESKGFRKAVTVAGIREHQAAFQAISDANGGNRVAGSVAYDASVDYVVGRMEAAGYDVSLFPFDFLYNADATPPVFTQVSPTAASYVDGVDFSSMTFSPNGDVTTQLYAVNLTIPPGAPGSSPGDARPLNMPASLSGRSRSCSAARAHSPSRPNSRPPPARPPSSS